MAHTRKDTYVEPPEWWKHLRWAKKVVSRKERQAAKKRIDKEFRQICRHYGEIELDG